MVGVGQVRYAFECTKSSSHVMGAECHCIMSMNKMAGRDRVDSIE